MPSHLLRREQLIPRPIDEVFSFYADAANLESITPDFLHFHIRTPLPIAMHAGTIIMYSLRWRGLPVRWTTEIREWRSPTCFVDVQVKGPYRAWVHTHHFEAVDGGTRVIDELCYEIPWGIFGRLARRLLVRADLEAIFDFRARRLRELLADGRR